MDFKSEIVRYIKNHHGVEVGDEESLFERGYLDSMSLLELMSFIEDRTGVRVPNEEVVPDNFETVTRIDALVKRLQQ